MTFERAAGLLVLLVFAWGATVWWRYGWFGLESVTSYRWPADPPPDLKPGYEPDVFGTRFLCITYSFLLAVLKSGIRHSSN